MDKVECKVMMIDCLWSKEDWGQIEVKEWPSIEALEKRTKFEKEEPEMIKYVESKIYLGTRESFADYGRE